MDGTPFRLPCLDLETNSCSDGHLSDIMPDVASSTVASSAIVSMGQLQLEDAAPESLQLDLGDRPGHMTCGGPSGIDLRNPQVSFFIFKFYFNGAQEPFKDLYLGIFMTCLRLKNLVEIQNIVAIFRFTVENKK